MNGTATMEKSTATQQAFDLCVRKTRGNIERLADSPKTWAFDVNGNYSAWPEAFYDIGNWTSSFFTGMALLAWRQTRDDFFLQQLDRLAPWYQKKVNEYHMDTMHDLGFLYSLYSIALYKQTGSRAHREVGLRAADVFSKRFMANGGYLQAWGRMDDHKTDYAGLAIIDCMMNLPLLYWATQETGDRKYHDIAVRHADTTLKHFIRPDDSVYHAHRFDVATGKSLRPANYCGRDVETHWARGTAWAIYGFALSHRYTGDARYLDASLRVARKFLQLLGPDTAPVWDFRLPAGEEKILDSSAASAAVCGLQELLQFRPDDRQLSDAVDRVLGGLCSDAFLDSRESCAGILKRAQVGDSAKRAKNAYTSWGDYYLMEAVSRQLGHGATFW